MESDQPEPTIKISARIPSDLYDWASSRTGNMSDTVREGLTLLRSSEIVHVDKPDAQTSIEIQYANTILDLQTVISGTMSTLKSQLDVKDDQIRELHGQLDRQAALIKKLLDEPKALPAPQSRTLWQMIIGR